MPQGFTERNKLSDVVAAMSKIGHEGAINYHYALVDVKGSGDVNPLGLPVVWNGTDAFEVYLAQDISATGASSLPNEAPVGVTVGSYEGVGANFEDTTLSATATKMWVAFRGEGAVKNAGIQWGAATSGDQDEFRVQLEKQGLAVVYPVAAANPSFV